MFFYFLLNFLLNHKGNINCLHPFIVLIIDGIQVVNIGSDRAFMWAVVYFIGIYQCHWNNGAFGHLSKLKASGLKRLNNIPIVLLVATFRKEDEFPAIFHYLLCHFLEYRKGLTKIVHHQALASN